MDSINKVELKAQIDGIIREIIYIATRYDPLPLLSLAYRYVSDCIRALEGGSGTVQDIRSEQCLRFVEYLQNIIISNKPRAPYLEHVALEDLLRLYKLFEQKEQLEPWLLATQNPAATQHTEEMSAPARLSAQIYYNHVRGRTYTFLEKYMPLKMLASHDGILRELFGIGAQDLVDRVSATHIAKRIGELQGMGMMSMDNFTEDEHINWKLMKDYVTKLEPFIFIGGRCYHHMQERLHDFFDRSNVRSLYDIQGLTNLPEKLLEALSLSPGENTSFMEGEYAGYKSMKDYPTRLKPFIKIDVKYYCFMFYVLNEQLYRALCSAIIKQRPEYKNEWSKKQGKAAEEWTCELFAQLLPGAAVYTGAFYDDKHKKRGEREREVDAIISFDDNLFIVEVKAAALSPYSPTSDPKAFNKSVTELIEKAYNQGKKCLEYLNDHREGASFRNQKKNCEELCKIRLMDYRKVTICCVYLEQLTDYGGMQEFLRGIPLQKDEVDHQRLFISLDDLLVYADLQINPLVFCHYLELREKALRSVNFDIDDELDHYGAYMHVNDYEEYFSEKRAPQTNIMQIGPFRAPIDGYYHKKPLVQFFPQS